MLWLQKPENTGLNRFWNFCQFRCLRLFHEEYVLHFIKMKVRTKSQVTQNVTSTLKTTGRTFEIHRPCRDLRLDPAFGSYRSDLLEGVDTCTHFW